MPQIHMAMEWIADAIEVTAVVIMVWAFVASVVSVLRRWIQKSGNPIRNLQLARYELGSKLVFALELLIVSDLIHTVVSHSMDDLIFLGALVAIRTITAYFLHQEIRDVEAELGSKD